VLAQCWPPTRTNSCTVPSTPADFCCMKTDAAARAIGGKRGLGLRRWAAPLLVFDCFALRDGSSLLAGMQREQSGCRYRAQELCVHEVLQHVVCAVCMRLPRWVGYGAGEVHVKVVWGGN
jgi:hypothetical protein